MSATASSDDGDTDSGAHPATLHTDRADLKWAVAHTRSCGSELSCIKQGTCLGRPICKVRGPMGRTAGFVEPTDSSADCGYCVPGYRGHVCFCPTRWALHRAVAAPL